jgi:tetratricopeptide (TPR) repeat protein
MIKNNYWNKLVSDGKTDKAIDGLKRVIKKKPDESEAYAFLGSIYSCIEERDKAIEYYKMATDLNPNDSTLYSILGSCLSLQGRNNEAVTAFKKAIKLCPEDASSQFTLGIVYTSLKKYKAVTKQIELLEELDPTLAKYLFEHLKDCYEHGD